jgi:hypothetical protein
MATKNPPVAPYRNRHGGVSTLRRQHDVAVFVALGSAAHAKSPASGTVHIANRRRIENNGFANLDGASIQP